MSNNRQEIVTVNCTQIILLFIVFFMCMIGDPDIIDKFVDIMNSVAKLITAYAQSL